MVDTNLAKAEAAPMAEIETSRAMRILVIDDNELDRQRVLRLCQQAGLVFESEEVASLSDLDNVLNANSFDLIFVDYLLTGETGLDALDMLAAHNTQSSAAAIVKIHYIIECFYEPFGLDV